MRTIVVTAVMLGAIVAGFLGFTKPGHQLLYKAGFTAACGSSDCSSG